MELADVGPHLEDLLRAWWRGTPAPTRMSAVDCGRSNGEQDGCQGNFFKNEIRLEYGFERQLAD